MVNVLMIIVIIGIVCVVSGLVNGWEETMTTPEQKISKDNSILMGIGAFLLISSTVILYKAETYFKNMSYSYQSKPYLVENIVAVQDNSEINGTINGSRYYTKGYINERAYYSYMVKFSDGGKKINKVPSDNTTIYEVDSNFRVESYVKTKEWMGYDDKVEYWKIYVPKGSITNEYNIDLK